MTIDEIREKYHCDKRQTGQVAFSPSLGTKYNLKGAGKVQKRELRAEMREGTDPLLRAKREREKKALLKKVDEASAKVKKTEADLAKAKSDLSKLKNQLYSEFGIGYMG